MILDKNKKINEIILLVRRWREKKASLIDQSAVLKDIYREVDISAGYFLMLTLANLIALNGLIQNSAAVIIGAMLISPLMGPILSFGFAFTTGNRVIWRKSVRKIVVSVVLTIIVALLVTFLSPLKDITGEIISRTRPNLYDLFIAFFAGTAGAVAICTKKNYLTIVPGVAIATAVIPPLSVTGFGLGIWNLKIAFGGFFLFFTNFVAIVISTCIIFFLYGFSPKYLEAEDIANLKKRITVLGGILFIISIPLIYTVYQSVSEVRERSELQTALQQEFNKEGRSHLDTFSYANDATGRLNISPVIKTVSYMKESEIDLIEKSLKKTFKDNLRLSVEQVLVQPGGLKEAVEVRPALMPAAIQPKPPAEIIKSSRENVLAVIRQAAPRVEKLISPSRIADFSVVLQDKTSDVALVLKINRDSPLSDEEILWLKRIFSDALNLPLALKVETVPYVPLLIFKREVTSLTDEMKKALSSIKDAYARENNILVWVEAYPESSVAYRQRMKLAEQRVQVIVALLTKEYGIPAANIKPIISKKAAKEPAVKIMVLSTKNTVS
jgi:uncharacterized hydrophobic protein (TIGR00271 family)